MFTNLLVLKTLNCNFPLFLQFFNPFFTNIKFTAFFYAKPTFQNNDLKDELQSRTGWDQFKGGFLVGAFGGSGFAYICLLSIPTFST